jgi:hypothetical protein
VTKEERNEYSRIGYRKPHRYLVYRYRDMKARVNGKLAGDQKSRLWLGLDLLSKDQFMNWAKNHPDYLALHQAWADAGYPRRLSPSIHRIDRSKGYTLDNIAWVTQQQNSSEALELGRQTRAKLKEANAQS